MTGLADVKTGMRMGLIVAAGLTVVACSSYPSEPRYSTRPMPTQGQPGYPPIGQQGYPQGGQQTYPQSGPTYPGGVQTQPYQPPVETQPGARAPVISVEGGALPPPSTYPTPAPVPAPAPAPVPTPDTRPAASPVTGAITPGASYEIQPGDTISGVGRRFQTPVQSLIDLNGLGPRGAISSGQRIILPDTAVDTGRDPYATGPSPAGVLVPENGKVPPPPPPPSGNAALPSQMRPVAQPTQSAATAASAATVASGNAITLVWPVRGEIVRRFGPVGMGERNNGINIAAAAGSVVVASAAGRVAYVGDDLLGQGLTVVIIHANGWRTVYGHLGSTTVRDGADVRQGQQIGTVGLTAGDGRPSIHYETRRMQGDDPVAVDPLTVLPR